MNKRENSINEDLVVRPSDESDNESDNGFDKDKKSFSSLSIYLSLYIYIYYIYIHVYIYIYIYITEIKKFKDSFIDLRTIISEVMEKLAIGDRLEIEKIKETTKKTLKN